MSRVTLNARHETMRNMNKYITLIVLTLIIVAAATTAQAAVLVDTGTPSSASSGWTVMDDQWVAGKFSIAGPGYSITDIMGYFVTVTSGSIYADITTDGGQTPSSTVLYSGSFNLNYNGYQPVWAGINSPSGLVDLTPGNYWVSFRGDSNAWSFMPYPAPNALLDVAIKQPSDWIQKSGETDVFGLRIYGEPSVIPEPATLSLLALGLFGFRLKKKLITGGLHTSNDACIL